MKALLSTLFALILLSGCVTVRSTTVDHRDQERSHRSTPKSHRRPHYDYFYYHDGKVRFFSDEQLIHQADTCIYSSPNSFN